MSSQRSWVIFGLAIMTSLVQGTTLCAALPEERPSASPNTAEGAPWGAGLYLQRTKGVTLHPQSDPPAFVNAGMICPGEAEIHQLNLQTRKLRSVSKLPADFVPLSASLSPDGRYLLYGTATQTLGTWHVTDLINGEQASCTSVYRRVVDGRWAPDGTFFIARALGDRADYDLTLFRLRKNNGPLVIEKQCTLGPSSYLPAFSPQGDKLAVWAENGTITISDLSRADDSRVLTPSPSASISDAQHNFWGPCWSSDGKQILLVGSPSSVSGSLFVSTLAEDGSQWLPPVPIGSRLLQACYAMKGWHIPGPSFAAWSPDGKRIAYQGDNGEGLLWMTWDLFVHDLENHGTVRLTESGRLLPPSAARGRAVVHWSPDGKQLTFMQFREKPSWNSFFAPGSAMANGLPLEIWIVNGDARAPEPQPLTEGSGDVILDWR
jgi:Tol biopolymer transport system component